MPLTHFQLDTVLVVCSTIAVCALEDPVALVKEGLARLAEFPNHYETQYDFVEHPLNGTLAVSLFLLSTFSWVKTYLVERTVVSRAHRKMTASTWSATQPWTHTPTVVAVHGFFSFVELCLGLGAILYRDNPLWARSAAAVALFINVPTGALLTPRVGIRHLIIPVFGLYGVLRALEAFKVLYLDHRLLPNLWILANGGTAVRLVGYYVTPYSSTDGARGDLFTEPLCYTFTILLSGYLVFAFVYPPVWLLLSLGIYAIAHHVWPPQVFVRRKREDEPRTSGSQQDAYPVGAEKSEKDLLAETSRRSYMPRVLSDNTLANMPAPSPELSHGLLNAGFASAMCAVIAHSWARGEFLPFARLMLQHASQFPNHYQPMFDFPATPMRPITAIATYLVTVYFLVKTYYVEKQVVQRAHRKFTAHGNSTYVLIHGVGSSIELFVGMCAILLPEWSSLAYLSAALALLVNVPSGFMLTPRVYGIKHLTVPGFGLFGVLRTLEASRVLLIDPKLVPNLWILLQVGTIVRLLGYFVLPFSSVDGARGDLFTEPVNYTLNILLSGYISAGFVYPPVWLLLSLLVYATAYRFWPPQFAARLRPRLAGDDMTEAEAWRDAWRESVARKSSLERSSLDERSSRDSAGRVEGPGGARLRSRATMLSEQR